MAPSSLPIGGASRNPRAVDHCLRQPIAQTEFLGHLDKEQAAGVRDNTAPVRSDLRTFARRLLLFTRKVPSSVGIRGLNNRSIPGRKGIFALVSRSRNERSGLAFGNERR